MLDAFFINENRGIKSGLVYCELESWILPAWVSLVDHETKFRFSYSFFTSVGILIACIQLVLLIFCCGCLKAEECLRVRSYTIDLFWAIAKEVPQIIIIFHLNLCRDGWFKLSSLFKAIFSILVTIWKLYNLYNFLRNDVKSEDIPLWCRAKRLYICFPIFLIPVWIVNLALSVMIAIFFVHRHRGAADLTITGSIRPLHIHNEYLYDKYIVRSGIYVNWPEEGFSDAFIKLAEIDSIMANTRSRVDLHFRLPYVCFQRTTSHEKLHRCYSWNNQTQYFNQIDEREIPPSRPTQSFSFNFRYKQPSNIYNLGQITYQGNHTAGSLYLNRLLYFRLHHAYHRGEQVDDFLSRAPSNTFQFYRTDQQLIPIVDAWRHGVGRCRPCVLGPQLILGLN